MFVKFGGQGHELVRQDNGKVFKTQKKEEGMLKKAFARISFGAMRVTGKVFY